MSSPRSPRRFFSASVGQRLLCVTALGVGCNVYDPSLLPSGDAVGGSSSNAEGGNPATAGSEASAGTAGKAASVGGGGASANVAGTDSGGTSTTGASGGTDAVGEGGMPSSGGQADGGATDGGAPPGPVAEELALGKSALASTTQTNNDAFKGNDGDVATRWCAVDGKLPQWWRVDLGAVHELSSYSVRFEYPQRAHSYLIETSQDDTIYTAVPGAIGTDVLGDVQSGVFPAGSSARYVRLSVTKAAPPTDPNEQPSATWASFFEFSVLGF